MEKRTSMKALLNRLIEWLKKYGLSEKEILDCISFITSGK